MLGQCSKRSDVKEIEHKDEGALIPLKAGKGFVLADGAEKTITRLFLATPPETV